MRARPLVAAFVAALLLGSLGTGCSESKSEAEVERAVALTGFLNSPPEAEDLDRSADVARFELTAAPATVAFGEGTADGYAYNGQVPGPTLRVPVGATVEVELTNDLDVPTTIHWHGVDVPVAMDGAPWNSGVVEPGDSFTYSFVADRAGTFWYHPHFDTHRQVDLGLYGTLIVEESSPPAFDEDWVLVFDTAAEALSTEGGHADCHGARRPIRDWLVNGIQNPSLDAPAGARVRARLINASNCGYLSLSGELARQIGGDQGRLSAPVDGEELVLGPGDRVELEWAVGTEPRTLETGMHTVSGPVPGYPSLPLATINPAGSAPRPDWLELDYSADPPTNDPMHTDIVYTLSGSNRTDRWLISGELFPEITVQSVSLGQQVVIEVRNLSPTEHPFHLHGHAFEVLSVNGEPPAHYRLEDTYNVGVHEVVRLLMHADNPGDWMTHCHILPHADGGMMTVLRVTE